MQINIFFDNFWKYINQESCAEYTKEILKDRSEWTVFIFLNILFARSLLGCKKLSAKINYTLTNFAFIYVERVRVFVANYSIASPAYTHTIHTNIESKQRKMKMQRRETIKLYKKATIPPTSMYYMHENKKRRVVRIYCACNVEDFAKHTPRSFQN